MENRVNISRRLFLKMSSALAVGSAAAATNASIMAGSEVYTPLTGRWRKDEAYAISLKNCTR